MTMEQNGDVRARFEQKIRECFEAYQEQWLKKEPLDLVEHSDEISAIRNLASDLPGIVSQEEMDYLLRFKNPLEVASDAWCGSVFSEIDEEEFSQALFEARDRYDLDKTFELADAAPTKETPKARREAQKKNRSPER